jgi:hypothetical protein
MYVDGISFGSVLRDDGSAGLCVTRAQSINHRSTLITFQDWSRMMLGWLRCTYVAYQVTIRMDTTVAE